MVSEIHLIWHVRLTVVTVFSVKVIADFCFRNNERIVQNLTLFKKEKLSPPNVNSFDQD